MKDSIRKITREANFLSLAGNLIIAFFGLVGFALLARKYPVTEFGEWMLYVSSASLIEMFRFGITNTAIVRYLSGANREERFKYIGSHGLIGVIVTICIICILWLCLFLFTLPIQSSGYELFFTWYPFFALVNLPLNTALVIMQSDQRFGKILILKSINSIGFFVVILLNFLFFELSLVYLVLAQIFFTFLTSGICIAMRWDGLRYIFKATRQTNKTLLDFGKYTTFTLVGTNLLRSADTLIISLSPLGTAAVALYSIPLKLIDIQQIPLRSFIATAFPKMSRASIQGNVNDLKKVFYTYSGAMSYLFLAMSLLIFIFADFLVLILGGSQYLGTDNSTGTTTTIIVRIFAVCGILFPIETMAGVCLDSINRPNRNFQKVMYMAATNIVGDVIAVFLFKSLEAVALVSFFVTSLGVFIGSYYMNKELHLNYFNIFTEGIEFYKLSYSRIRHNKI
jgi:O-antigen/teichoic acid export membrane protein